MNSLIVGIVILFGLTGSLLLIYGLFRLMSLPPSLVRQANKNGWYKGWGVSVSKWRKSREEEKYYDNGVRE